MTGTERRRCLVTGGAGFIGSHIVEALMAAGHAVAVLDDLSTGDRRNVPPGVPLHELDVTGDTESAFREFRPDVVVHDAAQISVSRSVGDPEEDARINVLGSLRLIQTLTASGVRKVVYASSGAAYGPLTTLPLREEMRPLPVSPYGISKYTVEHYLRAAGRLHGLEWVSLRYSNVFGPRQNPHGEAGVVAIFTGRLLGGQAPTIFDDGELTRDYIFVEDVARANVAAVERDFADHPDPVFNISTGTETSTNAIYHHLREILECDIAAERGLPRPGDVRRSVLDPARALRELGWHASVPLVDGLRRTVAYFRERHS